MHPGCQNTFPLRLIDRTLDFGDLLPCCSCPAKVNATGSENIIHMRTALARLLVAEKLQRVQNFLLDERFCTNGHCFAQAPFQSLRGRLCFRTTFPCLSLLPNYSLLLLHWALHAAAAVSPELACHIVIYLLVSTPFV